MRRLLVCCALLACGTDTFLSPDGSSGDAGAPDCGTGGTLCTRLPPQQGGFCSDFDEGSFGAGWTMDSMGAALPTVNFDVGDFTSCPTSLRVDVPQQTVMPAVGGPFPHATLTSNITAATQSHVTLTFDMKLPRFSTAMMTLGDGMIFVVLRKSTTDHWAVRIEHSGDGSFWLRVEQGSSASVMSAPFDPMLGTWNHMVLDVQFAPIGAPIMGSVSLTYTASNGMPAKASPADCPNTDMPASDIVTIIGATAMTVTSQAWSVYFDSLTMTSN